VRDGSFAASLLIFHTLLNSSKNFNQNIGEWTVLLQRLHAGKDDGALDYLLNNMRWRYISGRVMLFESFRNVG
jgi:hypothetical protein